MVWFMQGLCFLPLFLVISSSSTFIVSYVIAVFRRDVDVVFPYISDTGANPPESSIFGLMTFISACAGIATVYARYELVETLDRGAAALRPCLNKCALWFGMASCVGMCIVATFQETAVTQVHDFGALVFFVSSISYILLQSIISYKVRPRGSSLKTCHMRAVITSIAVAAFIPTVVCVFFVKQTKLHRHKEDKDYPFHLASAVCEWIVAFSFICYFLTYLNDFKLFTLRVKTKTMVYS